MSISYRYVYLQISRLQTVQTSKAHWSGQPYTLEWTNTKYSGNGMRVRVFMFKQACLPPTCLPLLCAISVLACARGPTILPRTCVWSEGRDGIRDGACLGVTLRLVWLLITGTARKVKKWSGTAKACGGIACLLTCLARTPYVVLYWCVCVCMCVCFLSVSACVHRLNKSACL